MCVALLFSLGCSAWADDFPPLKIAGEAKPSLPTPAKRQTQIAIIIDDLGYQRELSIQATQLPGQLTLSIIPFSPYGRRIAELATEQGKEVMLHAPMSSVSDKPMEPGTLTPTMDKAQFQQTLQKGLADLPNIRGLNNHMGSELTQLRLPMRWLMDELRDRGLYFVDSRTIASSLAWQTALDSGVPTARRDVFLDHDATDLAIAAEFGRLLAIAKCHQRAVAIAHPYPETLHFLETILPMLDRAGIQLVPVSQLLIYPEISASNNPDPPRRADQPREVLEFMTFGTK